MTDDTGWADEGNELRFTRVFDAPRALVFRCMVEPVEALAPHSALRADPVQGVVQRVDLQVAGAELRVLAA